MYVIYLLPVGRPLGAPKVRPFAPRAARAAPSFRGGRSRQPRSGSAGFYQGGIPAQGRDQTAAIGCRSSPFGGTPAHRLLRPCSQAERHAKEQRRGRDGSGAPTARPRPALAGCRTFPRGMLPRGHHYSHV